jgi:hypothetical protein
MELNEILIDGFTQRIKVGMMTPEQVPIPYQDAVTEQLEKE